jgi:hypothetical protein
MKEAAKPERKDFYFKAIDGLTEFDFYRYMDKIEEYVSQLQAKHEEELKQAVVKAYEEGRWVNSHISIPQRTAEQYYEANFKTKEL